MTFERAPRRRLARRILPACLAASLACGLQPPENAPPETSRQVVPPPGYRLAWADEFGGSALDPGKWAALTGTRRDGVMTADAAEVRDGVLTITTYTQGGQHRTGFLTTEGRYQASMGYVEARIKFAGTAGSWCAFWLNAATNGKPIGDPARAGVEIDVVEHRVVDQGGWTALKDMVALNLNWDGYGPERQNRQRVVPLPDGAPVQGAWHTYGVLWTEKGYTFYVDGMELWTIDEAVSRRGEAIYVTCEVEDGTWAGSIPPGGFGTRQASQTRMQVDWVRAWQPVGP